MRPPFSLQTRKKLLPSTDALNLSGDVDERKARAVELKFFGSLQAEEISNVLKILNEAVNRSWNFAKTRRKIALKLFLPQCSVKVDRKKKIFHIILFS